jgi:tRNA threonylcarbamoyladenosine biosynthesis protein TsaB
VTGVSASATPTAVLGVDTSTADSVVAVTVDGELALERAAGPATEDGRPRHASALLAEVDAAVSAAGGWDRIGVIAIGVGPGTFTGLRIGVATVRALAQARELPVAAVSSLAALARGIDAPSAHERPRLALIDARRGEVFAALHAIDGTAIWEPLVASPESIAERVADLGAAPLAAGDGSLRFRPQLEAAGVEVLPDADPAHRMAARHVCALAAGVEPGRPERVRPIYLRRPDAEVWRERGHRDSSHRRP